MQHKSVYYSATSLYMFRVSTTPIISSTQNCNYSLLFIPPSIVTKFVDGWWS